MNSLLTRRRNAADTAFEDYDFSPDEVKDHSGWTQDEDDENRLIKKVYMENGDEDSILKHFFVEFESNSAEVIESSLVY